MRFAIVGKGFIYPRHVQAIERLGHEVALTCDIDPSTEPDFTDWTEMFAHPKFKEIDAVSICTPNYLHGVIAREAIIRSKMVLCEKPLTQDGIYEGLDDVNIVLQLRHHPQLKGLKPESVYVEAKMFRDESYWGGWKGNKVKSGGVLFNLGVHYVDLLIYLLGDDYEILESEVNDKLAKVKLDFKGKQAELHVEIVDSPEKQGRLLLADGKEIVLSNQENLSYEDLHKHIYADFITGNGIPLHEAIKSLELIRKVYAKSM